MPSDDRDVLQVLKTELEFLRRGGYRRVARAPWRTPLYFEDSPSCPRLRQFSSKSQPCQHIRLSSEGHTLHALYRWATPGETRIALENWLTAAIERIEL